MNKFTLNVFSGSKVIKQFNIFSTTNFKNSCGERSVKIPANYGKGEIKSLSTKKGLSLILINLKLKNASKIDLSFNNSPALNFIHCDRGQLEHSLCEGNISYQLEPARFSITTCSFNEKQEIAIDNSKRIKLVIISIDRKVYSNTDELVLSKKLVQYCSLINDTKGKKTFLYQASSTLDLFNSMSCLFDNKTTQNESSVNIDKEVASILNTLIIKYKQKNKVKKEKLFFLSEYDLDCIEAAKCILLKSIKNPPIIPELAKLAGINQQKLKTGFKKTFGKTINQFIIQERMNIARKLLESETDSVRQASETVGYTNQSHFSSKFREHFGMLPKDFLKSVKRQHSSMLVS